MGEVPRNTEVQTPDVRENHIDKRKNMLRLTLGVRILGLPLVEYLAQVRNIYNGVRFGSHKP